MGALVPRAALRTAHLKTWPNHSTHWILPTRLLLYRHSRHARARAHLVKPAPPLLRAPETLCVFNQPELAGETRRRKSKRAPGKQRGGAASPDASGTRPVLGSVQFATTHSFGSPSARPKEGRGLEQAPAWGRGRDPKAEDGAWKFRPNPSNCNVLATLL